MRRFIATLVAAAAVVLGLVAVTPAQAAQAPVSVTAQASYTAPASVAHGNFPLYTTLYTSYKFWPYYPAATFCVAYGAPASVLPIGAAAQAWNNATYYVALDGSNNCVTDGYTPSTRMTIDSYSAADGTCTKLTNLSYATGDTFRRWTNNPVGWVNLYYEGCQINRAKWTSFVIGQILGLRGLTGSGWNNRVMSLSTATTQYPSASTDGPTVDQVYDGDHFGWY